jgi:AcrR family transcriptional regulator
MPYTPELTKSAVFRAAVSEFEFAGARVDRIAATAGVDKTAIYAHLGTKHELFDDLVDRDEGCRSGREGATDL